MVAEVCSFYVLRADGTSNSIATEGLNRDAPSTSRTMRSGEGLVGLIAASARAAQPVQRPVSTRLSPTSRRRARRSTSSFLGVPVLRGGNTLGVLVVQNRDACAPIRDDEIEALRNHGDGDRRDGSDRRSGNRHRRVPAWSSTMRRPANALPAQSFNEGVGLGHVVLHEPRIVVRPDLFNGRFLTSEIEAAGRRRLMSLQTVHRPTC